MTLLAGREITKSFGSRPILEGADPAIEPDARIGMVGQNGSGNSTLLRILAGLDAPDGSDVSRRRGVRVAYLDQHSAGDEHTALETVLASRPDLIELEAGLGALAAPTRQPRRDRRSRPDDARARPAGRSPGTLRSGRWAERPSCGERTRLQLLLLMLGRPNLLVLDEPTNHLDIESVEVLETAIEEFTGTVVAISHDRYFLDRVPDRIIEVDGSVRASEGGCSTSLERQAAEGA